MTAVLRRKSFQILNVYRGRRRISSFSGMATPALFAALIFVAPSSAEPLKTIAIQVEDESLIWVAEIAARAEGISWGSRKKESFTLTVSVNGEPRADIVAFAGPDVFAYKTLLGSLPAGEAEISVAYDRERSRVKDAEPVVESIELASVAPGDEAYLAYRNAPILYGPMYNVHSDVPLLIYAEQTKSPDGPVLNYTTIWSNEDGGTGFKPTVLLAAWGRTTDIEMMYQVALDADGAVRSEIYQAEGHKFPPFEGEREGGRPIFYTATGNNMVSDRRQGDSALRFCPPPVLVDLISEGNGASRESVMDANPYTHRLSNLEMIAEGKTSKAGAASGSLGDLRDYLYLDVFGENLSRGATLAAAVRLKGTEKPYFSDNVNGELFIEPDEKRLSRGGWSRTAVKLPAGTSPAGIEGVYMIGREGAYWALREVRGITLNEQYAPTPLFDWKGLEKVKDGQKRKVFPEE